MQDEPCRAYSDIQEKKWDYANTRENSFRLTSPELWDAQAHDKKSLQDKHLPYRVNDNDNNVPCASLVENRNMNDDQDDDRPYSPSHAFDGLSSDDEFDSTIPNESNPEHDCSSQITETIPLQLPLRKKSANVEVDHSGEFEFSREQAKTDITEQSESCLSFDSVSSVAKNIMTSGSAAKQDTKLSTNSKIELPVASPSIEKPMVADGSEKKSILEHLKQRAERLKKLEEMKQARQKLLAQIKNERTKHHTEGNARQTNTLESVFVIKSQKQETQNLQQENQSDGAGSSHLTPNILLETADNILSTFGTLKPGQKDSPLPSDASMKPTPRIPSYPPLPSLIDVPPLPEEAPPPPPPNEPPPSETSPEPTYPECLAVLQDLGNLSPVTKNLLQIMQSQANVKESESYNIVDNYQPQNIGGGTSWYQEPHPDEPPQLLPPEEVRARRIHSNKRRNFDPRQQMQIPRDPRQNRDDSIYSSNSTAHFNIDSAFQNRGGGNRFQWNPSRNQWKKKRGNRGFQPQMFGRNTYYNAGGDECWFDSNIDTDSMH